MRILKQNFQQLGSVLGETLINMFKPIVSGLNVVIGKFIQFAKVVSDSLGKIFGWQYQDTGVGGVTSELEEASDASTGVSDGLGNAANNAKKLKQQLQGFDELNVLTSDSGSGGSGGSGGGGGGGTSGGDASSGQWVKTESIFKDYESSLDSLYKLGDYIGTAITKSLNNIDWESVYEGARNFGSGLASFLNGLISPDLFGALGKTVAGSINTALHALNSFGETFEWKEFGVSIARGLTRFFETWDAGLTGETFSNFASGLLQSLTGFFETLTDDKTFEKIGQRLVDLICGIKWVSLTWDLTKFFGAFAEAVVSAPIDLAGGIAEAIMGKITGKELDVGTILNFDLADSFMKDATEQFNRAAEEIKKGNIGSALFEAIGAVLSNISAALVFPVEPIMDSLAPVFETIKNWLIKLGESLIELAKSIIDGLDGFAKDCADKFSEVMEPVWENLDNWLKEKWDALKTWFSDNFKFKLPEQSLFEEIKEDLQNMVNDVKKWWSENVKLPEIKAPKVDDIVSKVEEALKNLKDSASTKLSIGISLVKDGWKKLSSFVGSSVSVGVKLAKSGWKKLSSFVGSSVSVGIKLVKSGWKKIKDWLGISKALSLKFKIPKIKVQWGTKKVAGFEIKYPSGFKTYATGGFPEDGWFRANHGELMGKFDNGKTVVANNKQITQGIADAVYQGNRENNALMRQELELMRRQNELLLGILEKETGISAGELFSSVRQSASDYKRRTGRPAFGY